MEKKVLSSDFMQRIADEAAWKELSSDFNWSEPMLDKYKDKVDWKKISSNRNILWSISMIQKYKDRLNWDELSDNINEDSLTEDCISTFAEKWNWRILSSNRSFTLSVILRRLL